MCRGRSSTVDSKALRISSSSWKNAAPSVTSGWLIGASADSTLRRSLARTIARSMNRPSMRALDFDRVGEAAAGLEVERQRAGAEVDVEVEQSGRTMRFVAEHPGHRGRDGRRANAATDADDGGHDVRLVGGGFAARAGQQHLRMDEGVADLVGAERFQQIIMNAAGEQVAVEVHVVDGAGRDDDRSRLANLGERVDVVERIGRFRQVHEQDVRARRDRQGLDRVAQPALVDLLRRPAVLDRDRRHQVGRCLVADEGREGVAKARAGVEGGVQLPPSSLQWTLPSARVLLVGPLMIPVSGQVRYMLIAFDAVAPSSADGPGLPWMRSFASATWGGKRTIERRSRNCSCCCCCNRAATGGSSRGSPGHGLRRGGR